MKSPRGHDLVLDGPIDVPVLTVELYVKWYTLFLVDVNGVVSAIDYVQLESWHYKIGDARESFCAGPEESAYHDHVPNPGVVLDYANAHGLHVPQLAYELMMGRWTLES